MIPMEVAALDQRQLRPLCVECRRQRALARQQCRRRRQRKPLAQRGSLPEARASKVEARPQRALERPFGAREAPQLKVTRGGDAAEQRAHRGAGVALRTKRRRERRRLYLDRRPVARVRRRVVVVVVAPRRARAEGRVARFG